MRNCIEITEDSISVEGILAKLEIWIGNEEMVANDDAIHLVQVVLGNYGIVQVHWVHVLILLNLRFGLRRILCVLQALVWKF